MFNIACLLLSEVLINLRLPLRHLENTRKRAKDDMRARGLQKNTIKHILHRGNRRPSVCILRIGYAGGW